MTEPFTLDTPDAERATPEDLADGCAWTLDAIAAIDFLRHGDRHSLTLFEVLEEAIRWWIDERVALITGVADPDIAEIGWGDLDPLRSTLTGLLAVTTIDEPVRISVAIQQALRHWGATMSTIHNDGDPWPHPLPRKTFPPELVPLDPGDPLD